MARSGIRVVFLRVATLATVMAAAALGSAADRPALVLKPVAADALKASGAAADGGAWIELPATAAGASPLLLVEGGALPEAPALRVRARIVLPDAASAAGVALVGDDGGWVAAGLENGRPVLAPSDGRWAATIAGGDLPSAGPLWVELESVASGADRHWSLRLWAEDASRPERAAATASERRRAPAGETAAGAWLAGAARIADLQILALDASRSAAAPAPGAPWPIELDRSALRVTTVDRETRTLALEAFDAAPKSAVVPGAVPKSASSFPCDPYRHRFTGYAPGLAGSSALLRLPPVDNDCDGVFNEDPVNGRDDDGDGLADEDPAWAGDGLLSWTSSDSRLGELATGDAGAVILIIRLCWPTREYLTFATLTASDIVLAGGVRLVPEGGGVAVVGHDWQAVEYLLSPTTADELTVAIFESGGQMADGTWFGRPVALTFPTSGGSGAVTVTATIDGVPYTPGAGYAVEGDHTVHVVATDAGGTTATADGGFGIDLSPPAFSELSPASGEVVPSSPVVVTGRVSADALEVLVAGAAATLGVPDGATRPFSSNPVNLAEGPQVLELLATDRIGRTTTAQLVLDLDSQDPVVSIDSPGEGSLHPSQPVTVTGTVAEAHLASMTVNGVVAALNGDRFTAEVPLAEGGNTLTAVAADVFGRPGEATVSVVLDTTAPDISLETPADGSVVGESPITVTGHVEDPYLATVEVNGVAAVVTGTGFTAEGLALAEGPNTLTAVAADQAGNTAAAPTRVVVLDTLAPELTVSTAGLPTLTAAASVALSGTAVDPHLESVTVNGLPATVAGDAWSLAEVPLAEGENSLVVRAVDSLGHAAEAPPITIVRDSQPPTLVITEPADGAQLTTGELTVHGIVSDPHLDTASVVVNGVAATLTGDTFEATVALGEGATALVAEAADTLGHVGVSAAVTVTIDTLPPVVTLTVPLDPLVGDATVAVMGTVHEPHLESLTVAGIAAVVDGTGFTVDGVPLDVEGDNPLVAVARDTFGHETSSNVVVYVRDTTAPEIAITEPVEGAVLTATTLVVTGTVSDAHLQTVAVNGVAATVADGAFTAEIPAADGSFEIRAVATDAVGLTAEAAVTVLRDTLAPVVTIDQPAPAAGGCLAAGQPVTIAGSLAEASPATGLDGQPPPIRLEVVRSDGQAASFVGVLSPDGRSWSVDGVDLGSADGTAVATVIAADSAGQVSRASRSWRVDATAPAVTLLLDGAPFPGAGPGESPAPGAEPALLARAVVPRVVVSDPGGAAPQPVLTLDGSPFAPGTPIAAEGDHLLVARATDCAGRETVVHAFFRLDLNAPQLLSTVPADGALRGEGVETYSGTSDADLASATVNGRAATVTAGAFSVTPFAWREGENVVSLELVDEAGNRASFERRFTVRSLEPTLELLVDGLPIPPGAVFTRAIAPVVRCSDPEAAVTATLDGAPFAGGTLLDATGDHTLTATATDALDRTVTAGVSFRVDLEAAPTIAITSPADGDVLPEAVATVTGSLTGDVQTVTVNGLAAVVTGATFTAAEIPLDPDGLTTLVAIAVDGAGRSDSDAVTVTVRSGAPQLLITEPEAGTVVARAAVDVAGLVLGGPGVTADGTVTVAGRVTPVADDGSFRSLDVPLAAGANTLEATATDDQGRIGRATVTVVSDRTPPRVALTVDGQPVAEGAVFSGAISLEITVTDDDSEPRPPQVRLDGGTVPADNAAVTVDITAAGGHLLEVVATDLAGNEMRLERSLVIGGSGCAISSLEPAEGAAVAEDRVTLRGDVRDAVGVAVRVPTAGGDPLELDATLADGTFVAGDVPLPEVGENVLTLVCTDAAGATAEQTLTLERLAGSGPVVVLTAPADGARLDLRKATVTGTVDPATARVVLNGAEISVDPASGAFTAQLDLAEGPNVLSATAVDGAGRLGRDRVVVWRDTRAPQVRLTEPSSGTLVGPDGDGQATVRIAGVVDLTSEPHLGEIAVTTPAGNLPLAVDPVTGAFSAVVALDPALAGQPQQVQVSALDTPLGHEGVVTVSVTFDPAYPAIVLSEPAGMVLLDGSAAAPIAVTGEAWAAEGAQVAVNGEGLQPDQVSWQGPDASGRFHTAFSVTVPAPTEDGARVVVAQVTELGGARAQTLRTVVRDSVPPQLLELVPADGATGVDPDTLLFALLSEPVRILSLAGPDGLGLERLATATATAVERTTAGTAVALVPAARLAEGESYRLEAGLGILDLVGNPLGNPGASLFETAFGGVGAAPVLDALSEVVCAQRLTVAGAAAPGATLRLHDGDLALTAQADGTGRFAFDLPLIGPGFHLIRVAVVASDGREGASARAIVRVDCDGPTVERIELDRVTGVLRITLSEPIAPATAVLGSSVRVFDADGVERGAESLVPTTGDTVLELQLDPAADAWWRDAAVRVQVGPPLADTQGNALAGAFQTVLFPSGAGGLEGGFLYGEAWDDATGRPLENAVAALYVAGSALPGAVPAGDEANATAATVTDARGRFTLVGDVAPGRYVLVLSAADRTRVHRRLALEPGVGAVTFDSRLTPLADPAGVLDPISGGSFAHPEIPALNATFDPNAVAASEDLTLTLTPRSGQGLPDLLPLGWTPAAVAELRLETAAGVALPEGEAAPFAAGAVRLELPLPSWHQLGDELVAVRHHAPSGAWLTLPEPQVRSVAGGLIAEIEPTGPGTVALVVPDAGDQPPRPEPGPGHALAGTPLPDTVPELAATLSIDPPSVLPTGRATARVDASSADASTPWPSGLAVQAWLEERLILADGGVLLEAPVVADVLLYRCGEGVFGSWLSVVGCGLKAGHEGSAEFVVSPSERAAQVLLEVGWETVKVFPFPETLERGQTVGATGGTVTSADGVELVLPEGAVPVRTPVEVRKLSADEMAALPGVAGFNTVAAIRIDLDGRTLTREATLKMPVPAGVATDATMVLGEWIELPADGRGGYARLASRMGRSGVAGSTGERLVGAPEPAGSELPLEGIVREGLYLVLVAQQPIGYATGFVRSASGLGLADSRVTASDLGTADLSRPGGRYAVPVPTATDAVLTAQYPRLDERAVADVPALAAGEVVVVDLEVIPVPPTVTGLSPADGATEVTVGANLQVRFSEALDPATVGEGTLSLEVADASGRGTGAYVPGAVSLVNGATVLFQPTLALPAGYRFLAHFAGGVRDAGGVPYQDGPVDWGFTTSTVAAPGGQVRPELFHISIPVDGVSRIWADPGAVPDPQWTVSPILVNTATAPTTVGSYTADLLDPDSEHPITVGEPPTNPITLDSEVWIRVYDLGQNLAETFRLGPFASSDGLAFVAPAHEPTTFTTAENIEVEVPEGAFDQATVVRVTRLPKGELGVALSEGLIVGDYIAVDFEGEAAKGLRIKVQAPAGISPNADVFIGTPIELPWGRRLQLIDLGGVLVEGEALYLSNDPSVQPRIEQGRKSDGPGRCGDATLADGLVTHLLVELSVRATAAYVYEAGMEYGVMLGWMGNLGLSEAEWGEVFYTEVADSFVYIPPANDWCGQVVLPVRTDLPVRVVQRDRATGWILNVLETDAVINADGVTQLDFEQPDAIGSLHPPMLVGASPFDVVRFQPPPEGTPLRLGLELEVVGLAGDTAKLQQVPDYPFADHTTISVCDVSPAFHRNNDTPSPPEMRLEPRSICGGAGPWSDGDAFRGSSDMMLVLSSGDFTPAAVRRFSFQFDRALAPSMREPGAAEPARLYDLGSALGCAPTSHRAPVPLEFNVEVVSGRIVIEPVGALTQGHRYLLELVPQNIFSEARDATRPDAEPVRAYYYDSAPTTFEFAVGGVSGQPTASGDFENVTDMLRVGNLLVGAGFDGSLYAVDVSQATSGPGGFELWARTPSWAMWGARALASDGHNRIFFAGQFGDVWKAKAVRVEDILGAQPSADEPPRVFMPVEGGTRIAHALGSVSGTASEWLAAGLFPQGTPVDLELFVQDDTEEARLLPDFFRHHTGAATFDPETACSTWAASTSTCTFQIELTANLAAADPCPSGGETEGTPRYQRITVDNVTTGESWSVDVAHGWSASSGAAETVTVRGRLGDRLRVRRNLVTLGYVSIVGSGVTVLDLNRMYRIPEPAGPARNSSGQCDRRLAVLEGEETATSCPTPDAGSSDPDPNALAGQARHFEMTTAVAVVGPGSCASGATCEGAGGADDGPQPASEVHVFAPVTWVGPFHASAPLEWPQTIASVEWPCLRSIKVGKLNDMGRNDSWMWSAVQLRDVTVARDASWIDRGIRGEIIGDFEPPDEPPASITRRTGDLLFVTLGDSGIYVFDVTTRTFTTSDDRSTLIGRLHVPGHSIHRLQVDSDRGLLFAGGYGPAGGVIDIWSLEGVNSSPDLACNPDDPDVTCPPSLDGAARPVMTLDGVAWTTNHLGIDSNGTGLIFTWNRDENAMARAIEPPSFQFPVLLADPDTPPQGGVRRRSFLGASDAVVPLGVATELDPERETDPAVVAAREENRSPAFKLRVALPGSFGETVTARVQSLRALPDQRSLVRDRVGPAAALPGGPGWPGTEVEVTLHRLVEAADGSLDRLGVPYNLYESVETILAVADPRATREYTPQENDGWGLADEASQCRNCSWPSYLPPPDSEDPADQEELDRIKELLVGGRYIRAYIPGDSEAGQLFAQLGDAYAAPRGVVEVSGWADSVPSPIQVSLQEPALNPAMWSPGEAGVAVSMVSGEALLTATDHAVAGRALGFAFDRTYRSGTLGYGALGSAGWHAGLLAHLRINRLTLETEYYDGTGRVFRFLPVKNGAEAPDGWELDTDHPFAVPEGLYLRLQKLPGATGWRILDPNNNALYFDDDGHLLDVRDRLRRYHDPESVTEAGNAVNLVYDAFGQLVQVRDDYGRTYSLTYHPNTSTGNRYGLLDVVTDFSGRQIIYTWDDDRRLEAVELPGVHNPYFAGSPFNLDHPNVTYQYYNDGSVTVGPSAPLHGVTFSKLLLKGFTLPGETSPRVTLGYDSRGRVTGINYPLGVSWDMRWPDGSTALPASPLTITPPWATADSGHAISYALTPTGRLATATVTAVPTIESGDVVTADDYSPGTRDLVTSYSYFEGGATGGGTGPCQQEGEAGGPSDGRLRSVTTPDGVTWCTGYRTSADRLTGSGIARVWSPDADPSEEVSVQYGFTATIGGEERGVDNLPLKITDPMGVVSTLPVASLNEPGQAPQVVNPAVTGVVDGVPTTAYLGGFEPDRFGRTSATSQGAPLNEVADGVRTTNLTYEENPTESEGAGFLSTVTIGAAVDGGPSITAFAAHDDRGNVTCSQTSYGVVTSSVFDEWDRRIQVVDGGVGQCEGGPAVEGTSSVTAVDRRVELGFDLRGRLREQRQFVTRQVGGSPEAVTLTTGYNDRDQVVSVVRDHVAGPDAGGGLVTTPAAVNEYEDGTGLLRSTTSPGGVQTTYGFDAMGRVVEATRATAGTRRFGYDAMGRLVLATDGDEGVWRGWYNRMGWLEREWVLTETTTDPQSGEPVFTGILTRREFDKNGFVTAERTDVSGPEGAVSGTPEPLTEVRAEPTLLGQVSTRWLLTSIEPAEEPDAPPVRTELQTKWHYDPATARLLSIDNGVGTSDQRTELRLAYTADGLGRVTSVTDAAGNTTSYVWGGDLPWPTEIEIAERIGVSGALARTLAAQVGYDALGRVTSRQGFGLDLDATLNQTGAILAQRSGGVTRVETTVDGWGTPISARRPSIGSVSRFAYDSDGRLKVSEVLRSSQSGAGGFERTSYGYDEVGRLEARTVPGAPTETFGYNSDGTLRTATTRVTTTGQIDGQPLEVEYAYDAANRVLGVRISNPDEFTTTADSLIVDDAGDVVTLDALGRPTVRGRRLADGSLEPRSKVTWAGYDKRGLPASESVGAWGEGLTLGRQYDVLGRRTALELPAGLGGPPTDLVWTFEFDALDRVTAARSAARADIDTTYGWEGVSRLASATTSGPLGLLHRFGHSETTGQLTSLVVGGSPAGLQNLGGFGYLWQPGTSFKAGRSVGITSSSGEPVDSLGLVDGLGWSWDPDDALRLHKASTDWLGPVEPPRPEDYLFGYGEADELEVVTRPGAGHEQYGAGPSGRITGPRTAPDVSYSATGWRVSDPTHDYAWDWRGLLRRVDVKPEADAHPGEQVALSYDATGRLLDRWWWTAEDESGERRLNEHRMYLWDGWSLLAEVGLNQSDQPIWRQRMVPGPSGLDDTPQVQVEQGLRSAEPRQALMTLVRDELGSVVAVLEDTQPEDGEPPALLARYLYSPYGEVHVELGPELVGTEFEASMVELEGQHQAEDLAEGFLPGGVRLRFSIELDPDSLDAGVYVLERAPLGEGEGWQEWSPVPAGSFVIAADGREVALLPLEGWEAARQWRIRIGRGLEDRFGRRFSPPGGTMDELHLDLVFEEGASQPTGLPPTFDLLFDTLAAADALTCRHDEEGNPTNWPCFPGGQSFLFQGLWTDPVSGLSYARSRWYDPRSASWLSEDPMGAVDSVNLYAFVGWGPHGASDPMGLRKPTAEDVAVENELRSRVGKLDAQWESDGEAYSIVMWSEWKQKCALCIEQERVVDWATVHVQNEEQYRQIRNHLMNDVITFSSAVWEADEGGRIEYGENGFFTVTDDWRRAASASGLLLGGWNMTVGGNWALYATPYAVKAQMNQSLIAAEQEAAARSEAIRRMNPNATAGTNLRLAEVSTGGGSVPSNLRIRNQKLAGGTHPVTGVAFDADGHPVFQSAFDVPLPRRFRGREVPDEAQFSLATRMLWSAIQADPKLGRSFTLEQLRAIEAGSPRIPGWTWHHHQDTITLQLTSQADHARTGHTGGRAYEGGR